MTNAEATPLQELWAHRRRVEATKTFEEFKAVQLYFIDSLIDRGMARAQRNEMLVRLNDMSNAFSWQLREDEPAK